MFINGDDGLKMCLFFSPNKPVSKASSYKSKSFFFFVVILIVNTTTGESSSVCFNSYSLAFEVYTINVCTSVDKNHKMPFHRTCIETFSLSFSLGDVVFLYTCTRSY